MSNLIEYADGYNLESRVRVAEKSQDRWYQKKHDALVRDCLKLEIDISADGENRAELEQQLAELQSERQELNEGMKRSTLRQALGKHPEFVSGTYSEERIGLSAPAVTPAARQQSGKGDVRKIYGLAAVYEQKAVVAGAFEEKIARGAFVDCLSRGPDCRLLQNHDANNLLARTKSGTLRLYDKDDGLLFWGDMLESDFLTDSVTSRILRGDLSGCSFSFTVTKDSWQMPKKYGDFDLRIIEEIGDLYDVGPVTYPCYEGTNCGIFYQDRSARGTDPFIRSFADQERFRRLAAFDERRIEAELLADIDDEIAYYEKRDRKRELEIQRGYREAGYRVARLSRANEDSRRREGVAS